jgi:hypothetical protein
MRPRFADWSLGVIMPTVAEAVLLRADGDDPRALVKTLRFLAEAHRGDLDAQQARLENAPISG